MARQAGLGVAWLGWVRQGRRGEAGRGEAWPGKAGQAWRVLSGRGAARQGMFFKKRLTDDT